MGATLLPQHPTVRKPTDNAHVEPSTPASPGVSRREPVSLNAGGAARTAWRAYYSESSTLRRGSLAHTR